MNRIQLLIACGLICCLNLAHLIIYLFVGELGHDLAVGAIYQWVTLGVILVAQTLARPFWEQRRRQQGPGPAVLFWRPIESAPRDGREILLAAAGPDGRIKEVDTARWELASEEGPGLEGPAGAPDWQTSLGRIEEPTHWLPLPHLVGERSDAGAKSAVDPVRLGQAL